MIAGYYEPVVLIGSTAEAKAISVKHARGFWITGMRRGELRDAVLPSPRSDEVLVRALYGAVSRGTESLVYRGEVPASEHTRMRAPFQQGDFPWPVQYGYINVGRVEQGPSCLVGREVFCLYPHQSHYVVPAAAVVPLPDGLPAARAVLAANLETAINALWDGNVQIGDRVAVVGGGAIGCLIAWLASKLPGCEVELVDINSSRAAIAGALGVGFAHPDDAVRGVDRVFHASGSGSGLCTALELAGFETTVVELSWFGSREVSLGLGAYFHSGRLSLRASQVGTVAAVQRARWTSRRRLELALRLLAEPLLDVLISSESRFDELPQTMLELDTNPDAIICHRIVYG